MIYSNISVISYASSLYLINIMGTADMNYQRKVENYWIIIKQIKLIFLFNVGQVMTICHCLNYHYAFFYSYMSNMFITKCKQNESW